MAKKKAKEEVIQQPDTSNREENKAGDSVAKTSVQEDKLTLDDFKNVEEIEKMVEEVVQDERKKLKLLAADRLNSLINEANELGITDVVQILNSDKYGQFYMVYRQ